MVGISQRVLRNLIRGGHQFTYNCEQASTRSTAIWWDLKLQDVVRNVIHWHTGAGEGT